MEYPTHSGKSTHGLLEAFGEAVKSSAGMLYPGFVKQRQTFGAPWEHRFEELLRVFVADDNAKMTAAVEGYAKFVMDGMRLQKRFEKTRQYEAKTYEQASEEVYLNM